MPNPDSSSPSPSLSPPSSPPPSSAAAPSLEKVHQAFSDWRASGRTRRTPKELQRLAALLLDQHSISTVSQALGLDRRRLRGWREELLSTQESPASATAGFVDVAAAPHRALSPSLSGLSANGLSLTLTRQDADGSTVSISGHLEASGWRWALGLLREPGR